MNQFAWVVGSSHGPQGIARPKRPCQKERRDDEGDEKDGEHRTPENLQDEEEQRDPQDHSASFATGVDFNDIAKGGKPPKTHLELDDGTR